MGWEYSTGGDRASEWHEGFLVAEFVDGKRALGICGAGIPTGHLAVDQYGDGSFGQEAVARHGGDGAFHTRPAGEVVGWRIVCNCYSPGDVMPSNRWFSQQLWARVPSPVQHNPRVFRIYAADDDIYDVDTTEPAARDVWWNDHINAIDAAAGIAAALAAVRAGETQLDEAVVRARQNRLSWAKIGAAAGMSGQAAHERWSKRCDPTPDITYYAKLAANRTRQNPSGIVRRIHTSSGPTDEAFGRDLQWHPTEYLRRYRLGHNDVDHEEITAGEAQVVIDRWCIKWANEDAQTGESLTPIRYDQTGLRGRTAELLTDLPRNDAGVPVTLPAGTTRVVIVDDTPNSTLTLRVHPVGEVDRVVFVDHAALALAPDGSERSSL
ncbi:hypothetical protein [Mycolicibacterium peregrinum]|uniref:Uncharacterized protein n=1 Tax=Mycolicibacterium peregrinum TaxID=43304 RepID=A0A1A0WD09_MYCPR|nr:hypothetical protein [Mycolicibacterium peregrinum]OBB95860.1 hypothetical protein A5779_17785 [Mycolicibacterium peregrinum]